MYQRDAEAFTECQSNDARDKIVTVNDVIRHTLFVSIGDDAINECICMVEDEIFVVRGFGPGREGNQRDIARDRSNPLAVERLAPGEDVDGYATTPKFATEFADIDVHSPGFFAAESCKWARMYRQHRNAHNWTPVGYVGSLHIRNRPRVGCT